MFTERLSILRTEKRLTHQEMADRLGITRQAYGYYENGKRKPDHDTLIKLADFFDVDTDYLLGRSDIRKRGSHETKKSLAFYGGTATDEELAIAEAAIDAYRKGKLAKDK